MKVAVCVGGLLRGHAEKNIQIMKDIFPYDFFLSTWDTVERFPPFENIKTYVEPPALEKVPFNHPNKKIRQKLIHHHKQILAHAYMLNDLASDYDMIVRTRYDLRINSNLKWNKLLKISYDNNIPIGVGSLKLRNFKSTVKKIYGAKGAKTVKLGEGLNDAIIFHPRKLFNVNKVFDLYEKKELGIAEHGWWQVLVKENFGDVSYENDPCQNYIGGVILDRYLIDE
jgi:hypothetical protein